MNNFIIKENSYGHRKRLVFITKQIEKYCLENSLDKKEIKVLDVGCGSGLLITLPLGELGYNILGIDIDDSSINFANNNNIFSNVSFKKSFVEDISEKYDIILACEILEHLENPLLFLESLKSKLNENGIIIITTPNGYGWSENESHLLMKLAKNKFLFKIMTKIEKNRKYITLNKEDKHLQKFTFSKLMKIFSRAGLRVIARKNGPVFGGPITERTFAKIPGFKSFSNSLADILPPFCVLVWYFVLKNK